MKKLPFVLLLAFMPLGVAGQNTGLGLTMFLLLVTIWRGRQRLALGETWRFFRIPLTAATAYLAWQIVSTFANPLNPDRFSVAYVFGHLAWAYLPFLLVAVNADAEAMQALASCKPTLSRTDQPPRSDARGEFWRQLSRILAVVVSLWGVLAISQTIWGWRLGETGVEFGFPRAQGLYSHPMSLAYAGILLFSAACMLIRFHPRNKELWLFGLGALALVLASESRTVQVVSAGVAVFAIWKGTRGMLRIWILSGLLIGCVIVLVTENPVGLRFRQTLVRHDVRSDYADDRLAIWHANFNMVRERPLLGHGEGLTTAYRRRFYEEIGLKGFVRQYEAHNVFLQLTVNGGVVGLGIFLVWVGWHLRWCFRRRKAQIASAVGLTAITAFLAAGITQNDFQDSTVRYVLTLLVAALWLDGFWTGEDFCDLKFGV